MVMYDASVWLKAIIAVIRKSHSVHHSWEEGQMIPYVFWIRRSSRVFITMCTNVTVALSSGACVVYLRLVQAEEWWKWLVFVLKTLVAFHDSHGVYSKRQFCIFVCVALRGGFGGMVHVFFGFLGGK